MRVKINITMIMNVLCVIAVLLALFVMGKYIIIFLLFPFQCLSVPYKKRKSLINKLMAAPYFIFDCKLLHGGWTRYMLYQVARVPSHHFRRFIYKCLGLEMTKAVSGVKPSPDS